jgi:alpha-tubulin suppressor-like RCC1 family protein
VVQIAINNGHGCVLRHSGSVLCWGLNRSAQVSGDGVATDVNEKVAVVPGLSDVTQIATGVLNACALTKDGSVHCWGANDSAQASADGHASPASAPDVSVTAVAQLAGAKQVEAGYRFACAVTGTGTVTCWGTNHGAPVTGDGKDSDAVLPLTDIPGLAAVKQLGVGSEHACALLNDGSVKCWGRNDTGQCSGDGAMVVGNAAVTVVAGLSDVIQISVGQMSGQSCALLKDGTVRCWGDNFWAEASGDGKASAAVAVTPVAGIDDAVGISAGAYHTCVVHKGGGVSCWGDNAQGQVAGDLASKGHLGVTAVKGVSDVVQVAADGTSTCALLKDSTIRCWGKDTLGQSQDVAPAEIPLP